MRCESTLSLFDLLIFEHFNLFLLVVFPALHLLSLMQVALNFMSISLRAKDWKAVSLVAHSNVAGPR